MDLDSTNGTMLNGEQIESARYIEMKVIGQTAQSANIAAAHASPPTLRHGRCSVSHAYVALVVRLTLTFFFLRRKEAGALVVTSLSVAPFSISPCVPSVKL